MSRDGSSQGLGSSTLSCQNALHFGFNLMSREIISLIYGDCVFSFNMAQQE